MPDTKILQAILNRIKSVDNKVDEIKKEVVSNGKRIDKLGLRIANLEDDAPTIEEFDKLEKRVSKLEQLAA